MHKGKGKGGGGKEGKLTTAKVEKLLTDFGHKFELKLAQAIGMRKGSAKAATKETKVAAAGKSYWTCPACKDSRCFESRLVCHKCGTDRPKQNQPAAAKPAAAAAAAKTPVPQPPGLPAAGAAENSAESMAVEIEQSLEAKIAVIEGDLRLIKEIKSAAILAQKAVMESELQMLKEQQKKERPLPARLQAATHRLEKMQKDKAEQLEKLEAAKAVVVDLETGLKDIEAK